jgi:hypothetical protein
MMRLTELQRALQNRVLRGTPGIEFEVSEAGQLDTYARLGIYENAFVGRLVEALALTYPALRDCLGDSAFAALTCAFVAQAPPSHFSVRYFGGDLASFVARHYIGVKAQVLSDLARWEWALGEAFDAPDASTLAPEDLGSITPAEWAGLRFRFAPALRTLSVQSNAVQWWRASTQDGTRPARWRTARPIAWAVWRNELQIYFRSLQPEEAWAVDAMADGHTFAFLCDGLARHTDEVDAPTLAASMLHRWLSDGWIVRID